MTTCCIDGCGKVSIAKGLCRNHYMKLRRTGSPMGAGQKQHHGVPLKARLMARVVKGPGCWEWQGGRNPNGYGMISVQNYPRLAHRISWEVHKGAIPDGLSVLHKCDNPACVRPGHLFLGTHYENTADKMRKGRHRFGLHLRENHPRAKLTDEQVREIRRRTGDTTAGLAREFGVSEATMWAARHGKTWRTLV